MSQTLRMVDVRSPDKNCARIVFPNTAHLIWLLFSLQESCDAVKQMCRSLNAYINEPGAICGVQRTERRNVVLCFGCEKAMNIVQYFSNQLPGLMNLPIQRLLGIKNVATGVLERRLDGRFVCAVQYSLLVLRITSLLLGMTIG